MFALPPEADIEASSCTSAMGQEETSARPSGESLICVIMPSKAYSEIGDHLVEFVPDGVGRDEGSPDLTDFFRISIFAPLAMSRRKIGLPRSSIFDVV